MGRSLDEVMDALPADRREKIEARARELTKEELASQKNNPIITLMLIYT